MSPTVLSLPCAILISVLVARMSLSALHLPLDTTWLTCAVLLCTLLLCNRNLPQLILIAILAGLVEMHSFSNVDPDISPEILLSVLIALIVLPLCLNMMGLSAPKLGPLSGPN